MSVETDSRTLSAKTRLVFDGMGKLSDYATFLSHPGQLNITITSFQMRGNATVSLHPESISPGAKTALAVENFASAQATNFRVGKDSVVVVNPEGSGTGQTTYYQVETRQSVLSENQFERITSAVYYTAGELKVGGRIFVDAGATFIAPPTLVFSQGQLHLKGSLSTSMLVLSEYSEAFFGATSSTAGMSAGHHRLSVLRVVDGSVLHLADKTWFNITSQAFVGGHGGSDSAAIETTGVVRISSEKGSISVLQSGAITSDGRGSKHVAGASGQGGSHGGRGGDASDPLGGADVFGDSKYPISLGAGGTAHQQTGSVWKPIHGWNNEALVLPSSCGGGAVVLSADTLTVDGAITANGADGDDLRDGGGAGGSVWITATNFAGSGRVSAHGGSGGVRSVQNGGADGAGGGGGRIAIHCTIKTYTGMLQAYGATGSASDKSPMGAAGTVYEDCGSIKDTLTSSISKTLGGVLILKGIRMDVLDNRRVLLVGTGAEIRLRALAFSFELEAGYVGLIDQAAGVTINRVDRRVRTTTSSQRHQRRLRVLT